MATTIISPPVAWNATGRITATGSTSVFLTNPGRVPLFWAITDDDTAPAMAVADAHYVENGGQFGLVLADGERLWLAVRIGSADITITTGIAV